jgi:hypothetical protein
MREDDGPFPVVLANAHCRRNISIDQAVALAQAGVHG